MASESDDGKSVSIIGGGWYGAPLALELQKLGYTVRVSCTSAAKAEKLRSEGLTHVEVFAASGDHPETDKEEAEEAAAGQIKQHGDLFNSETVIICIPPRLRALRSAASSGAGSSVSEQEEVYLRQIRQLARLCQQSGRVKQVCFVSTTSVYGEPADGRVMKEEDELRETVYWRAEQAIIHHKSPGSPPRYQTTILRFAGLMGHDRILARFWSGRLDVDGEGYVNLIHRDDAIAFTIYVLQHGKWGQLYNVVTPVARTRRQILDKSIVDFPHFAPIGYSSSAAPLSSKIISCEKLTSTTDFVVRFPDPLDFFYVLQPAQTL